MPESPLKVLLIEDDEDDFIITRNLFSEVGQERYELAWAPTYEAGREQLLRGAHDLYLIDYRLGIHNGLDLLREAKRNGCAAPIIMLTGVGDQQVDIEAIKSGAADYLVKGQITPALLHRAVTHAVQRKNSEQQLRESEEQLRQAQKMESLGTLAGGIAHDFNNLLCIILGHASSMLEFNLDANASRKAAESILKAAHRGANLVKQILTFARKTELSIAPVNVNNLIEELTRMLADTFHKTIAFSLHLGDDVPFITGNSDQLHQSLLNLCVNARDAMPNGGKLSIRTEVVHGIAWRNVFPEMRENDYVCISVSDTGTGMDESTRTHIFEPFFTTKSRDRGSGLGLAVVYGVIKSHSGFIQVESEVNRGTTFRTFLPVPLCNGAGSITEAQPVEEPLRGTETVLVVEDEELLRELVTTLLSRSGYKVLIAGDGHEAIEVYKQHQNEIALVLADIGLPKLSGIEALTRMKEINPGVKAILASGYLDPELMNGIQKAGANDFLQKPYVPTEICRRVRLVLDALEKRE